MYIQNTFVLISADDVELEMKEHETEHEDDTKNSQQTAEIKGKYILNLLFTAYLFPSNDKSV